MKYCCFAFLFFANLSILAVPCQAQVDSSCPPPVDYNFQGAGPWIPPVYDMMQSLSPNGKMLSYLVNQGDNGAHIVNLKTLADTLIIVNGGLPLEEDINWSRVVWCPYDSDILAINVASLIDTENKGIPEDWVTNAFIYHISTGISEIIRPAPDSAYWSTGISGWLAGSKPGSDSLIIGFGFGTGNPANSFYGIYIPQKQTLIPKTYNPDSVIPSVSPDGKDTIASKLIRIDSDSTNAYYLNSRQFIFPRGIDTTSGFHYVFSPDSKLLALEVTPYLGDPLADSVFPQVWVYNTSDPTKAIDVINFQQLYCKYSLDGIWPIFLTDSTLAVSMHHDSDIISPLWEIKINGDIIRQLTFLPENPSSVSVSRNLIATIHIFPNPSSSELDITAGPSGTARLFDLLGRDVLDANDDGMGATLDVSHLEAGIYFLRLGNQSAKVDIAR